MSLRYLIISGTALLLFGLGLMFWDPYSKMDSATMLMTYLKPIAERGSGAQSDEKYEFNVNFDSIPNPPLIGQPFSVKLIVSKPKITLNGQEVQDPQFRWQNFEARFEIDGEPREWEPLNSDGTLDWTVKARQANKASLQVGLRASNGAELNPPSTSKSINLKSPRSERLRTLGGGCISFLGGLGNILGLFKFLQERKKDKPSRKKNVR